MGRPIPDAVLPRGRHAGWLLLAGGLLALGLLSCGSARSAGEAGADGPPRVGHRVLVPDSLEMDVVGLGFDSVDGPIRCAMFVSRGLRLHGQPEIALGVAVADTESLAPLEERLGDFFTQCWALARAGRRVGAGSHSVLDRSTPLFVGTGFNGIVYTTPDAGTRELVGPDGLLAVVVTERELAIAAQVGHTRLLSRLGERARFFPTPPWTDRARAEVLTDAHRTESVLDRVPRLALYGSSCWMTAASRERAVTGPLAVPDHEIRTGPLEVTLELDPAAPAALSVAFASLGDDAPLALLTGLAPALPRCLTWSPGGPTGAISHWERRGDRRCGGNFVLFTPGHEQNEMRMVEDGFALLLRDDSWRELRDALRRGAEGRVADARGRTILTASWRAP